MASKTNKPVMHATVKYPRAAVSLNIGPDDSEAEKARKSTVLFASNEMAALRVMRGAERKSGNWEHFDVPSLMDQLRDQAAAINRGDLAHAEAMLMNQATALQSLFARLAERGMSCEDAAAFEVNMRIALRAQSQCRATLETLATIKNPPIVYARQANVTTGPQQINNGAVAPSQAREIENEQTQLLRADHGEWMDTGTTSAASGTDKDLATVGAVNRDEVGRR